MKTQIGPLTHRRVLNIALPIVLSNATVPLLGLVDTGVVGQLGRAEPIGAVGIGAVILTSIFWIFGFLRMGTTGLAAQAEGQGDRAEVAAILTRVLMIGLAAGTAFILLRPLIFWGAFAISPASEEVERLAQSVASFQVLDDYRERETEADALTRRINAIADEKAQDAMYAEDLRRSLETEEAPSLDDLRRVDFLLGHELPHPRVEGRGEHRQDGDVEGDGNFHDALTVTARV